MKILASQILINATSLPFLPTRNHVIECAHIKPATTYIILNAFLLKSVSSSVGIGLASSSKGPYSCKATHTGTYPGVTHWVETEESREEKAMSDLPMEQVLSEEIRVDNNVDSVEISGCEEDKEMERRRKISLANKGRVPWNKGKKHTEEIRVDNNVDSVEISGCEEDKEMERRRKISLANKGRVPWNKGKKHTEETRERIKQRTIEALKNPKVKKKMSAWPHTRSDQTKGRISSSMRKLWAKRLHWNRSREKVLQAWAESIANAARIGGIEQQELDWDSYDKIKREIALEHLQQAAEKENAKLRARAERESQAKEKKMAKLTQKKKEREAKAKLRAELRRKKKQKLKEEKLKEEKEQLAVPEELGLRERLVKIHRKKSTVTQVTSQHQRPWEKFDMDDVEREKLQKEISLADQIRFAKNRRSEYTKHESTSNQS